MAKSTTTMSRRPARKGKASKVPRLILPDGYKAQTFIRTRQNGQLAVPAFDGGLAWSFKLSDVTDYTEFTTLYDAYVLDQVDILYVLENNNPGQYPVLMWAPDYDDAVIPTTDGVVSTHQNVKIHPFSENKRSVVLSVRPRALQNVYQAGVTSGYGWAPESQIIDMGNVNVEHFGIKTWMSHYNSTDTPGARIRTFVTYHLRFVGQR